MRKGLACGLMLACLVGSALSLPGQSKESSTAEARGADEGVSPEQEQAALEFVRTHHPELEKLLVRLRKQNRREFEPAIRQLHQTVERLSRLRERDPERHEISLQMWKADSRIRLLAARMTMSDDPVLEDELRSLLRQRLNVRRRQFELDRSRAAARLEKANENLAELESEGDAMIEQELQRLKRTLPKRGSRPKDDAGPRPNGKPITQAVSADAPRPPDKGEK